jgi:hypothetical protein
MAFGDFTVTRASTKLRIGSDGLYGSVANNVPAFEFNTDGTYRGLLVEPGATNLALQSQDFTTTWATTNATVTANQAVAPDGATTADLLVPNSASTGRVDQNIGTLLNATTYTMSCYMKQHTASLDKIWLYVSDGGGATGANRWGVEVNLVGGFALTNYTTGTGSVTSASAQNFGNGWYRIVVTGQVTSGMTTTSVVSVRELLADASTNGTNGVLLWQAQFETGSVATSPIVTTAGTASRVADVVSLTGASSLIGQTGGGTMFVEVDWRYSAGASGQFLLAVSDNSTSNRANILVTSGNELRMLLNANGVSQTAQGQSSVGYTGIQKIAFRYAQNNAALYRNGSSISTDITFDITALASMSRVDIGSIEGSVQANMWIRAVALFPTPLTDAQLASLTA